MRGTTLSNSSFQNSPRGDTVHLSQKTERVLLVSVDFPQQSSNDLEEFELLALSAGADIVGHIRGTRSKPDATFFVGRGKIEEIKNTVQATKASLVIFNHELSAPQERNIEKEIQCRVIDRQGLILDIFAQRARTFEGKLQVELALLQRMSTRLIRGWTHLERQKGGIGLRGPGETQLEIDRRLLKIRIQYIKRRLEKVKSQRNQNRQTRHRSAIPTVALVGYTNAGKSTLFNHLTDSSVFSADQLFATLDPTLRRIELAGHGAVILADTVGFIRDLPHELVEAFSATLEETRDADLLLHVIDAHDQNNHIQIQQVNQVLEKIGANQIPQLLVYNKIDLLQNVQAQIKRDQENIPKEVFISAKKNIGLDELSKALSELLYGEPIRRQIFLRPEEGQLRAQLYALKAVKKETVDEQGNSTITIEMSKKDFEGFFPDAGHPIQHDA